MSETTVDLMEYSTNALAQAAYVSNGSTTFTADLTAGQTFNASSSVNGDNLPWKAFDDNFTTTKWMAAAGDPAWISCQWASGKVIGRITIQAQHEGHTVHECKLEGSNDGVVWTKVSATAWSGSASQLNTDEIHMASTGQGQVNFGNNLTSYSYYRIYCYNHYGSYIGIEEIEMMERTAHLLAFSESSIKTEGSYSLKGYSLGNLNKTFTRTVASPINLSGKDVIRFDIRASRAGSNIKIGVHDSGGTTTEVTPNILVADTFQVANIDLTGVANANKDAIDQIIITTTNVDAVNTFYIDNMFGHTINNYLVTRGKSKTRLLPYSGGEVK